MKPDELVQQWQEEGVIHLGPKRAPTPAPITSAEPEKKDDAPPPSPQLDPKPVS